MVHRGTALLACSLALLVTASGVRSGPNEGGILFLHYDGILNPTCDDIEYCDVLDFENCDEAVVREDGEFDCAAALWVFAAFPDGSSPRVTSVSFGFESEFDECTDVLYWIRGSCGSGEELAGESWPQQNTGTTISWIEPQEDPLLEVYVFSAYAYDYYTYEDCSYRVELTPHPTRGGVFEDDSVPPVEDLIVDYGAFGFQRDGYLPPCPPAGACCFDDGTCVRYLPSKCELLGGAYEGDDTQCEPSPCSPAGACCFADGSCLFLNVSACGDLFGSYGGAGVPCEPNPCEQPLGACCFPDLSCEILTPPECLVGAGSFLGGGTVCEPGTCGGACCTGLTCEVKLLGDCQNLGGTYLGDSIECGPNPCQTGACCLDNCTLLSPYECEIQGGVYLGAEALCSPGSCSPFPTANRYFVKPDGTGDYPAIRDAILDSGVADGTTVELADGLFLGPDNHNLDFLGKAVRLRSRSGDPTACVLDCDGPSPVERGFFFGSPQGEGTEIYGITIRNGRDFAGSSFEGGAGIRTDDPGVRLRVENCRFESNRGRYGGGVHIRNPLRFELVDCVFEGNLADVSGGGAYLVGCVDGDIRGCEFEGNAAESGGGAVVVAGGAPEFLGCGFLGNEAQQGGAAELRNQGNAVFRSCRFESNLANSLYGGAVSCDTDGIFEGCLFHANSAIRFGGAVYVRLRAPRFEGCTFVANGAPEGGTFYSSSGTPIIESCIVVDGTEGPAVDCDGSPRPIVTCTDIHDNVGGDWVGCIAGLDGVDGNFSVDPLFCDYSDEPFSLNFRSPCLPNQHPAGADCGLVGAYGVGCPPSGIEDGETAPLPTELRFALVTPNPVRNVLEFVLELPGPSEVSLSLVDVSGRNVVRLQTGTFGPGVHRIATDSAELSRLGAGIYFAHLVTENGVESRKVVLAR